MLHGCGKNVPMNRLYFETPTPSSTDDSTMSRSANSLDREGLFRGGGFPQASSEVRNAMVVIYIWESAKEILVGEIRLKLGKGRPLKQLHW